MKLKRFEVRNYKGIEHAQLFWDDILVLIGDNNCGKSSILQALALFLSGSAVRDEFMFRNKFFDEANAIELIGEFTSLTAKEKENKAVQGRMDGDKWILKKKFWCETGIEESGEKWKEMYFSFSPTECLRDWPDSTNSWTTFPDEYKPLIEKIPGGKGARPNKEKLELLRGMVKSEKPELVQLSAATWVQNPGGGGNWKSNANSILPKLVWVKAVHDAADSLGSKNTTAYGQLLALIIEKKLMQRTELAKLKVELQKTLDLIGTDDADPSKQAQEIKDVQNQINQRLDSVISGIVNIYIDPLQIPEVILPSTYLLVRDHKDGVPTQIEHHGHGLQRTLIMALLQVLAEEQRKEEAGDPHHEARPVILAIDEPELYMHPQMERKMRDALYLVAKSERFQVICTTHSPVFLDVGQKHSSIVRIVKDSQRNVKVSQVTHDLFDPNDTQEERDHLILLTTLHPTMNEVFFAKRVVILEERSAEWAIRRAAEVTGIFSRHPHLRRDVMMVDCAGKGNIPAMLRVLNHFQIGYTVIHDEDQHNPNEQKANPKIAALIQPPNRLKLVSPDCLEMCLGYTPGKDKPYQALKFVEELFSRNRIPQAFIEIVNEVYFGSAIEPVN